MTEGEFYKLRKDCPYYKYKPRCPALPEEHLCFMAVGRNHGDWQAKPCNFKACGFMYWWQVFRIKINKALINL